ncbi:MAG: DUF5011 domain-containing protein [bacterium]|nr:DUF5011 domain-containing protein [bacterium]
MHQGRYYMKSRKILIVFFLLLIVSLSGCGDNKKNTKNEPGDSAPVITLKGHDTIYLWKDEAYTDPGYRARDDKDGDITARVTVGGDTVDTAVYGTYSITYSVSDSAGNEAPEVTRKVTVSPPIFVAVGAGGRIMTSPDGITWTDDRFNTTNIHFNGIAYGNDMFLAVDLAGVIVTSSHGFRWEQKIDLPFWLFGISYGTDSFGDESFIAVGDDAGIFRKMTGRGGWSFLTWDVTKDKTLWAIDYDEDKGIFIAVGEAGYIMISSDSSTWEDKSQPVDFLFGITHGGGKSVAVGPEGLILTSADGGNNWDNRSITDGEDLHAVSYGEGKFIAVGKKGCILISDDGGDTWENKSISGENQFDAISYGNGIFVAVGENGYIVSSDDDGDTWITRSSSGFSLFSITYGPK